MVTGNAFFSKFFPCYSDKECVAEKGFTKREAKLTLEDPETTTATKTELLELSLVLKKTRMRMVWRANLVK